MSSKIYQSMEELIGHTPVVRLNNAVKNIPIGQWLRSELAGGASVGTTFDLKSELYAKIEFMNPAGSVKDRVALSIIDGAEKRGELLPGGTIVEATSGNTGAGLALVAALRGYKCIFVMPDKMSAEKINALRAYGAKVLVCPCVDPEHPNSYYNVARRSSQEVEKGFLANQYYNPDNPKAHFETTGPEIWDAFGNSLDVYFAGLGTGGTFSGTAKYLKEKHPKLLNVGIDPEGSLYYGLIREKKESPIHNYLIEGVGEDFVPGTVDLSLADDCVQIGDAEAFAATQMLARKEGLLVGGSCGMAFYGAAQWLIRHELKGGKPLKALVILPDSGSRYLSKVFNETWLNENKMETQWPQSGQTGAVEYIAEARKIPGV